MWFLVAASVVGLRRSHRVVVRVHHLVVVPIPDEEVRAGVDEVEEEREYEAAPEQLAPNLQLAIN